MFDFRQAHFEYDPYPIGLVKPILAEPVYAELVTAYPPKEIFEFKKELGNKYSLSEVNNASQYRRFISSSEPWRKLHAYVKGDDFIPSVLEFLKARNIDLGLKRFRIASKKPINSRAGAINRLLRYEELSARFEFSMMDSFGGSIRPHTDSAQKLITLVVSMMAPGEWNTAWGGGTEIVRPKDKTLLYNHINKSLDFSEVEILKEWDFSPNQCVVFVKTFNSWHSVTPMRGAGQNVLRKTLTINIEAKL